MKDNISPEEKLLRLIKKGGGQEAVPGKKTDSPPAADMVGPGGAARRLLSHKISKLNSYKAVLIAFLISCLYLIISFSYPFFALKKIKLPQAEPRKPALVKKETLKDLRPFEFYLNGIKNRQIFNRPPVKDTRPPTGNIEVDSIRDIGLLGVVLDNDPQAIIEDKKLRKTYYVRKGQFVGSFQVEDVQEGRVILNRSGERFELQL